MGWDGICCGYDVASALRIVHWSTPFLTRHKASRLGGFAPGKIPSRVTIAEKA